MPVPDYAPEIALGFDPFAALDESPPDPRRVVSAVFYLIEPYGIGRDYYLVDIYDEDRKRVAQLRQVSPSPLATTWESKFFETIWWLPHQVEEHAEHAQDPDPDYKCRLDPDSLKWATDNYMLLTAVTALGKNHQEGIRRMGTLQGDPAIPLDDIERVSFQAIQDSFVWDPGRLNLPHELANQLRR